GVQTPNQQIERGQPARGRRADRNGGEQQRRGDERQRRYALGQRLQQVADRGLKLGELLCLEGDARRLLGELGRRKQLHGGETWGEQQRRADGQRTAPRTSGGAPHQLPADPQRDELIGERGDQDPSRHQREGQDDGERDDAPTGRRPQQP